MQEILVDSGPIIALFNESDLYHEDIKSILKKNRYKLVSTWPVATEVSYMLGFSVDAQTNFLSWIYEDGIILYELNKKDIIYCKNKMLKYSDVPMDLADASIMAIAENKNYKQILTIDGDFNIYKRMNGTYLENIYQKKRKK